jgi:hypothetical protein
MTYLNREESEEIRRKAQILIARIRAYASKADPELLQAIISNIKASVDRAIRIIEK